MQSITFLGAARTVTGSKHLLELNGKRVLVDCGLFQGGSQHKALNWQPFAVPPNSLDAVVITHAHIDHIGWLPRLVHEGYQGPIYATSATIGLSKVSLPDSGRLQEEEARYLNRKGLTRHNPALPLYTEAQAFECLKRFVAVPYNTFTPLPGGAQWRYLPAGHILGSAFAEVYFENGERIVMSGDLGRKNQPILHDPAIIDGGEYLVVESTYGDKEHSDEDVEIRLEQAVNDVVERGSCLLVPSFAIGRTQELLFFLHGLQEAGRIPTIPIYVDSPMGRSATELYARATEEHDEDMTARMDEKASPLEPAGLIMIRDRESSKAINDLRGPMIIICGSGMATGGRVIHHLMHRLGDRDNIVLFTGYQAEGTLGRRLIEGDPEVSILGQRVEVVARIDKLNSLSAHADRSEILDWLGNFKTPPRKTFLVHGEYNVQLSLAASIKERYGWTVEIPEHHARYAL